MDSCCYRTNQVIPSCQQCPASTVSLLPNVQYLCPNCDLHSRRISGLVAGCAPGPKVPPVAFRRL